jgi:hypothetical protein
VARDENPHDWLAVREPGEVGRFSFYAEQFLAKLCARKTKIMHGREK